MFKRKTWFARLSRAARWRLGAKEAEEVIADYREMVGDPPRPDEELIQELGKPLDAVKHLTEQKTYRLWLAVFLVLAACLALAGTSPLPGIFPTVNHYLFYNFYLFEWLNLGLIAAFLGAAGAIIWFRWKGWRTEKCPKAVPVLLAAVLVWLAAVLAYNWVWMHDPVDIWGIWGEMPSLIGPNRMVPRFTIITGEALEWIGGFGMTVVGIFALVKARMSDRRWAAVYVLAMTAMLVSLETLSLLLNMNFNGTLTWESYYSSCFYPYIAFAAVGLVGTGAALC